MSSMNKVMLIGNLGADPEIRYTQSNTCVATLSVATTETWIDNGERRERTEWHRVVVWGRRAEVCQQYLAKGSKVFIEGGLQTRKWQDKDGVDRYSTEVKASEVLFLTKAPGGERESSSAPPTDRTSGAAVPTRKPAGSGSGPSQQQLDDVDEDLPF